MLSFKKRVRKTGVICEIQVDVPQKTKKKKQNFIISLEMHEISKLTYMLQNYPKQTLPDRFRLLTFIIIKHMI